MKIDNYIMKTPCAIFLAFAVYFLFLCPSILAEKYSETQDLQGASRLAPDRMLSSQEQSKIKDLINRIEANSGGSHAAITSRQRAISRLQEMRHKQALPILKKIAEDKKENADTRVMAINATLYSPDSSLIDLFIDQLSDEDPMVRAAARRGLIDLTGEDIDPIIQRTQHTPVEDLHRYIFMQDKWRDWWRRNRNTFDVSSKGIPFRGHPWLDPNRALTIQEQAQLDSIITQIKTCYSDNSQEAIMSKKNAIYELRKMRHIKTLPILLMLARNEEEATKNRLSALLSIQYIPDKSVIQALIDLLSSPDRIVSYNANNGLKNLTKEAFGPSVYVSDPDEVERRYRELQNNWRVWWQDNKDTFYMPLEPSIVME
ncbi:MAG: HEAT repeat domain-containing protein [Kiritimatiellae bacterium]|nr:HEAT repeat domain-containing protein [Kiritimatiellia bacterium]